MQEIKITIGKNGKVNLDVAGVKGSACSDLTKSIEKALGRVEVTKKKSEFYQQSSTAGRNQTHGNCWRGYTRATVARRRSTCQ